MELEHLRTFLAVAELGGFSAAGQARSLTQSAVSAQVQKLEARVGARLFERTTRTVTLTAAGGALLPHARQILRQVDSAASAVAATQDAEPARLGLTTEQAERCLPAILERFAADFPDVPVHVTCAVSTQLIHQVQAGLLDVALAIRHGPASTGEPLFSEALAWIGAPNLELRRDAPLPLACNPEGCIHRRRAVDALARAGRPYAVRYTSDSPAAVNAAVVAGRAVGVKARRSVPDGCRPLDGRLPALEPVVVELHRAPAAVTAAAAQLADIVRSEAAREGAQAVDLPGG
jgi:DNA-binding transcriptional LysR family regulator